MTNKCWKASLLEAYFWQDESFQTSNSTKYLNQKNEIPWPFHDLVHFPPNPRLFRAWKMHFQIPWLSLFFHDRMNPVKANHKDTQKVFLKYTARKCSLICARRFFSTGNVIFILKTRWLLESFTNNASCTDIQIVDLTKIYYTSFWTRTWTWTGQAL